MRKVNAKLTPLMLLAALSVPLNGCAATVGQQFRDIMAEIDAQCRKDKMGPYLDPNDPHYIDKRPITDCDILKIKPADPLATEEGRFAYSIKLPEPHDKLKAQYLPGMGAETYFKSLCEKDAGDFVFRTVEGVEGIKIMRPSIQSVRTPMLYEMPGSAYFASYKAQGHFVSSINGKYAYVDAVEFESERHDKTQLIHYAVDAKLATRVTPFGVTYYPVKQSHAQYGYTFRGLNRSDDRELGIFGGELIILDMATNEVLAFRRMFYRSTFINKHSADLMTSTVCPNALYNKDGSDFIADVLKPKVKGEMK